MLFIDTDLIYYGFETKEIDYRKAGWDENTMENQFDWIESGLLKACDSDYVFVFGHHPVNVCGFNSFNIEKPVNMVRLANLLDKNNISAYIFGNFMLDSRPCS